MKDKFDPKLKEVMSEIRAIIRKHDLGGHVILVSKTHGEFGSEITPSWSCLEWQDKNEGQIRFFPNAKAVGAEAAKEKADLTVHLLFQIKDLCQYTMNTTGGLLAHLGKYLSIEHRQGEITPHKEQ